MSVRNVPGGEFISRLADNTTTARVAAAAVVVVSAVVVVRESAVGRMQRDGVRERQ